MVLKIDRENDSFSISNGFYDYNYNMMREELHGHPNGIVFIGTNSRGTRIAIESGFSITPPNDGKIANSIRILETRRAQVEIGQRYGHGPGNLTLVDLEGSGSYVKLVVQGEVMTFRHRVR